VVLRKISTELAPFVTVSDTSSRATLAPARGDELTLAGDREDTTSTHSFADANTRLS
jgi:hypothetical protein